MKQPAWIFVLLLPSVLLLPQRIFANRRLNATAPPVIATVTAYSSPRSSRTASGTRVSEGIVACPRKYPFGTRFRIDGKVYRCQDRASRRYGNRFDIWKPNRFAARAFGKRKLAVVVIGKPELKAGMSGVGDPNAG